MAGGALVILAGVDVGGTFTDLVLTDTRTGQSHIHKVPTTDDPSEATIEGLMQLSSRVGIPLTGIEHVFHGTTIATNAVLTHDGAKTGLITTDGYRDILHIGRHQRPQHYSLMQDIPWQDRPLVLRRHRKVVRERVRPPHGEVEEPLDEHGVRAAISELKSAQVQAIAICFLFSYLNSEHEDRVRSLVEEEYPEAFVTTSASIFPRFREFERFTTAALNAFIGPKVKHYLLNLSSSMARMGLRADLRLMRSNGGVATVRAASEQPVTLLMSGPAAGVLAGNWIGQLTDRRRLITFDVGGTSADIGIVDEQGLLEASARDTSIAGYPVMVPMIDIETVGAGGGSIAYVDAGGAFRVGPQSAGANPGPACYGRGGSQPTVTDANLVLGRLDPNRFLGGRMRVDAALAEEAIRRLGSMVHLGLEETAEGVLTIATSNMANAIRGQTIRRGKDPRDFTLVAFGGAGPLHAADVAESLEIPEILVPPHPGITSAVGLLTTDLRYDAVHTEFMISNAVDVDRLNSDLSHIEDGLTTQLRTDGVSPDGIKTLRTADCRYVGQGYELSVPVPEGTLDLTRIREIWDAFHERHAIEYGHSFPGNPIELVGIHVVGIGSVPRIGRPAVAAGGRLDPVARRGEVLFQDGAALRAFPTTYYDRERLQPGTTIAGPAIVLQEDSTTVVPPGWSCSAHANGALLLVNTRTPRRTTDADSADPR